MKSLLICPVGQSPISALAPGRPAFMAPAMGRCPLEYWLVDLACAGIKKVTLMAPEHPALRALAIDGARWGLSIEIVAYPDDRNTTADFERSAAGLTPGATGGRVDLVEHFPGMPHLPIFDSFGSWFSALSAWMPKALTADRVGVREIKPGVWVSRDARISARAELVPPCWIGQSVSVGSRAVIGPNAILEEGVRVEPDAEIVSSQVGPATLIGRYSGVRRSLAFGNRLFNWELGSETAVPGSYLMCALKDTAPVHKPGWWQRFVGSESSV